MEIWKPVVEFPQHYEVSSFGNVKSVHAYHPSNVGRIRKPQHDKRGYVVFLLSVNSKPYLRYAHRLVAEAFLGPIGEGMEVNHKDGDKGNPQLSNLEIVSRSENRAHSYRVLGVAPNRAVETNGNASLSWAKVDAIRAEYAAGGSSYLKLSRAFGVSKTAIANVLKKRCWRDEDRPPSTN
jgi:hypothetical protein